MSATDPVGLADESANESTPQPNQTNANGCGAAKSCEGTPEPAEGAPDFDKMDLSSLQGSGPPIGSPEHIQQLQKGGNQASIERKMAEAKKMMAPPAPISPKWHVPNASAGAAHETLKMAGESKNGLEKTIGYSLGTFLTGASILNGLVVDAVNFPADLYAAYENHENGNDVEAITSGTKGLLGAATVIPIFRPIPYIKAPIANTFESSSKFVGEAATAIERAYPGFVLGVDVEMKISSGLSTRIITDADILLRTSIIEVKSGKLIREAERIAPKIKQMRLLAPEIPYIVYAPEISEIGARRLSRNGILFTSDLNTLIEVVKP